MRRGGQRECGSFLISLPAQLAEKMVAFILYLGYSTRQKRPDLFDSAQDVQIASRVAVDVTAPTFNARELGARGGGGGGVLLFLFASKRFAHCISAFAQIEGRELCIY